MQTVANNAALCNLIEILDFFFQSKTCKMNTKIQPCLICQLRAELGVERNSNLF